MSAVNTSNTATDTFSGTSMATPHVAGAAAVYLQNAPSSTPAQVRTALLGGATLNVLSSLNGSTNTLLRTVTAPPPPGTAPVATVPTATLPAAVTWLGSSTVALTVRWSATDPDGHAISRYEVQEQRGSGSWTMLYIGTALAGTRSVTPSSSTPVRYRVRAIDSVGAVGGWATTAPLFVTLTQQSSSSMVWGMNSTWSTHSVSGALGGSTRRSRTAGATASLTFTGTQVDWVATRGSDRGRAEVFIDGISRGVIDLYASSTQSRRAVFSAKGLAAGRHTIRIKVLGTKQSSATTAYVDVDGFIVLR